jgi:hypothetical protein
MKRNSIVFILIIIGLTEAWPGYAQIQNKLYEITWQVQTNGISFSQGETNCLKLLANCSTLDETGKVYLALAEMYKCNGLLYSDKIAEYCELALKYPQDTLATCNLFSTLGDAFEIKYEKTFKIPEKLEKVRPEITRCYLAALAIIYTNHAPEKWQKPPAVNPVYTKVPHTDDPNFNSEPFVRRNEQEVKRHEAEMQARKRINLENNLLIFRDPVIAQVGELYNYPPNKLGELREAALQAFQNTNTVEMFMDKIRARVSFK